MKLVVVEGTFGYVFYVPETPRRGRQGTHPKDEQEGLLPHSFIFFSLPTAVKTYREGAAATTLMKTYEEVDRHLLTLDGTCVYIIMQEHQPPW